MVTWKYDGAAAGHVRLGIGLVQSKYYTVALSRVRSSSMKLSKHYEAHQQTSRFGSRNPQSPATATHSQGPRTCHSRAKVRQPHRVDTAVQRHTTKRLAWLHITRPIRKSGLRPLLLIPYWACCSKRTTCCTLPFSTFASEHSPVQPRRSDATPQEQCGSDTPPSTCAALLLLCA